MVSDLSKSYFLKGAFLKVKGKVSALKRINFKLFLGESLAVIGESGSGKSTLALIIAGLLKPDSGRILFRGEDLLLLYRKDLSMRRKIQIIFQDPYNTLNPRYTLYQTLLEPLLIHSQLSKNKRKETILYALQLVGLRSDYLFKYPHQLSGGERQRVAIARAIILGPELLICDEPTSNLDVSIQAQIINLLLKIKAEENLSLLFITHDINIASVVADRMLVLYQGEIVEEGNKEKVLDNPENAYTRSLIQASLLGT